MFRTRTSRIPATLAVIDIALFVLSGLPKYKNAHHDTDLVVGEIVWFGFLVGTLALLPESTESGSPAPVGTPANCNLSWSADVAVCPMCTS